MPYKVTISVPEIMMRYVHHKVRTAGYGTVSEYIRELIRLDQRIEIASADAARERSGDLTEVWRPDQRINRGA
jgi:Arc/MetJ-type ribon-helix-helix transcriptional regulator